MHGEPVAPASASAVERRGRRRGETTRPSVGRAVARRRPSGQQAGGSSQQSRRRMVDEVLDEALANAYADEPPSQLEERVTIEIGHLVDRLQRVEENISELQHIDLMEANEQQLLLMREDINLKLQDAVRFLLREVREGALRAAPTRTAEPTAAVTTSARSLNAKLKSEIDARFDGMKSILEKRSAAAESVAEEAASRVRNEIEWFQKVVSTRLEEQQTWFQQFKSSMVSAHAKSDVDNTDARGSASLSASEVEQRLYDLEYKMHVLEEENVVVLVDRVKESLSKQLRNERKSALERTSSMHNDLQQRLDAAIKQIDSRMHELATKQAVLEGTLKEREGYERWREELTLRFVDFERRLAGVEAHQGKATEHARDASEDSRFRQALEAEMERLTVESEVEGQVTRSALAALQGQVTELRTAVGDHAHLLSTMDEELRHIADAVAVGLAAEA